MRFGSVFVVLALSLASAPSSGANFDSGRAAADAGDLRAMPAPGRFHVRGVGAPQNYVEAHMWLNLAAGRGDAAAAEERDALALKMTAEQVASAPERAARRLPEAARVSAIEVGDVFRDCPHCPEMAVVPAGSFTMGSPASEEGRYDDESPQHRVRIGSPFAVGVYEVTFAEWDACVSSGGCGGYRPDSKGWGRGQRPAINVSWDDAQAYVVWLSRETGAPYRLLSESEWEYAARAGTTTRYWWGDDVGRDRTNCPGCRSRRDWGTDPVGSFDANAFGLHDVLWNVWEWVQDCWNDSYAGAPVDGSAWEDDNCSLRVLRGGSWDVDPEFRRAAYRGRFDSGKRYYGLGFRVARTVGP